MKLSFNFKNLIPKNKKTKNNMLTVFLIVLSLVGFVFMYNSFFKSKTESVKIDAPESISGKVINSSEASESVINKIKRDIQKMQEELKSGFYSNLRDYRPSGEIIVKPGRRNPFSL